MAEQLYGLTFSEITGKVPVFQPDVRVWEVTDKASGDVRRPVLRRLLRARGQALGRVDARATSGHETFTRHGRDADRVEQQQLRQGRAAASRC